MLVTDELICSKQELETHNVIVFICLETLYMSSICVFESLGEIVMGSVCTKISVVTVPCSVSILIQLTFTKQAASKKGRKNNLIR